MEASKGKGAGETWENTTLYRHFDREDRLLYVGISLDAIHRLGQHRQNAHWYNKIDHVTFQRLLTRERALKAEADAIRNENPLHNIAGREAA